MNEKRNKRKCINCPVCNNSICKCVNGLFEYVCKICHTPLVIDVSNERVEIFKSRRGKERHSFS